VYVGHFAAGLAIKARVPAAPTWALLLGVGLADLLFAPFVLLGLERASITPGISPGFSLGHIDWSHSLLMSLVWSGLYGMLFLRRGTVVAAALGLAVFSHFLLDLFMHPPDLALWPGSSTHLGLGLWQRAPVGWWYAELAVIALGFWYYWRGSRHNATFGGRARAVGLVLLLLHVFNAPWWTS
jgi:membrane-bound metal-dependent hydrolase YbcI (DUF457 family)